MSPLSVAALPRRATGAGVVLLCFLVSSAAAAFNDVTTLTGINYVHAIEAAVPLNPESPSTRPTRTIQSNYAGAAVVDVDGDGWTDLLAARYNLSPVLYINQGNGTFREEAVARGLGGAVNAGAFGAGDLDKDGDADLVIVPAAGDRYWLFLNDGTGHFTEAGVTRGVASITTLENHEAYSVGLVDFDRDGFLDISVREWGIDSSAENALHSVLLRNVGAAAPGFFENVTASAGVMQPPTGAALHYGFASAWADFDDDGWPDLAYVGDFGASQMFWNNGNGTFTETEIASGVGLDEFGMGVAVADYDNDGRLDFYVTSIFDQFFFERAGTHRGNKLYRNLGARRFAEVARTAGVERTGWGWGAAFCDFDHDGDQDLVVTNGMDAATIPTGPFFPALDDATVLFQNLGAAGFTEVASLAGIRDTGYGKAVVVWDYDHDGDQDLVITQTFGPPVIYRNDASTNGRHWLRFKLHGVTSNRDGIGAVVRVTEGTRTQTQLFNPSNAYIGQHESFVHFGLGSTDGTIDAVEISWPSGIVQTLGDVAANQVLTITEPAVVLTAPVITEQPMLAGTVAKDATLTLSVTATGNPAPVFVWEKDGVAIPGANQPAFTIPRVHPFDAGTYRVQVINTEGVVTSNRVDVVVTIDPGAHSVARWWNEFLLDAIRRDRPNPPVHARNLFHLSAAMWDAFRAYPPEGWTHALPVFHREDVAPADWIGGREAAQNEAIAYASYQVLRARFQNSPGRERSQLGFRWLMQQLGYDPDFAGITGNGPAAVGNRIGAAVLAANLDDGANEAGGYADITGYAPVNPPLIVALPGAVMNDPSRWQPLALAHSVTQNDIPLPEQVQSFVGVNARMTRTFAVAKPTPDTVALDPGPPPRFGGATHAAFVQQAIDCIGLSARLDPADGVMVDISPGAQLNNPLGTNAGTGYARNPVTGQPYAANVVAEADFARVLAEYWADGPASETPPGHWNVLHNEITDDPRFVRRFAGIGPELSPLEWDVRAYLALNGAVHDAACVAWTVKHQYDSSRPISVIRHLAGLGQSSDPAGPSYDPLGLPLLPGLIEVVTAASIAAGERHAHLAAHVGEIAIRSWRGQPSDPATEVGGVGWILGTTWLPYQLDTFVSPAFPGYVSGHSTFSRSAAEVMTLLTGSPFFPGGLGEFHAGAHDFLRFETGPSSDLTLQWATYYDAADQAGLSRLYGGIHPSADDLPGRRLGSAIGLRAFVRATDLRSGADPARGLINISSRGRMGSGDDVMIAGFVIEGSSPQPMLVRSVGPELEFHGIPLARCDRDPRLEVHRSSDDAIVAANDDWGAGPRALDVAALAAMSGAFALSTGSADAAEVVALAAGSYTVVTPSRTPAARGLALAEVYGENLVNLSIRGSVGPDDGGLIAGFVIETPDPGPVLIRAVGPGLAEHGVSDGLANPVLRLYRHPPGAAPELIATNDDWSASDTASLTASAAAMTGAFPLTAGSRDAALLLPLPTGIYSVVVTSADGSEGVALAEVYRVK